MDCEEYGNSYQVTKKIQMITNCSCSACHPRGQQPTTSTTTDNEVTYPASEPRHPESFFNMLSEDLLTKLPLDQLRRLNAVIDQHQEQGQQGKMSYKVAPSYSTNEDEEDPNVVMNYS